MYRDGPGFALFDQKQVSCEFPYFSSRKFSFILCSYFIVLEKKKTCPILNFPTWALSLHVVLWCTPNDHYQLCLRICHFASTCSALSRLHFSPTVHGLYASSHAHPIKFYIHLCIQTLVYPLI